VNGLRIAVTLLVCLYGGASALAAQTALASLYGRPIAGIVFEPAEQPLQPAQLELSLELHAGDTLEATALGQAIERLWATGRFADIVVSGVDSPAGVTLHFRTQSAYFLGNVRVEGVVEPPNAGQLASSTKLNLGEPFDEEALPVAVGHIETLLRANGFYGAHVQVDTTEVARTQEMHIHFQVDPGPRARFTTPVFDGPLAFSPARLERLSGWQRMRGLRGWHEVTSTRVQRALERIQSQYLKSGYLMASVRMDRLEPLAGLSTVRPRFVIDSGPRVRVRATGVKLGAGELRRLIPIYEERTVDRELLIEGARNLENHFHSLGYFDAKATYSTDETGQAGEHSIRFDVERGPRYRLVAISVQGNHYFNRPTIEERLSIIAARFPRYRRGRFSPGLLEQDQASIESLYRSNGFRDVVVKTGVDRNWKGHATDIAARIEITEGPQWVVTAVNLTGVDLKLLDSIRTLLTLSPGQPYALAAVAADRDAVLGWYFNNGYPEANFDVRLNADTKAHRVELVYSITEGRRNFVREVIVGGLRTTRPELVTARVVVKPGEPLSQSAVVESQRRLYDLGIFAKVDVATQNPEGRERNKYVLMQAEEAKRYSVNFGFGAEMGRIGSGNSFDSPAGNASFAPRGQIGLTRSNIFGLAHTASATLRASNIQQRLVLSYLAPQFLGHESTNLTFSSLLDRSRDVRTFVSQRWESSAQVGQRLSRTVELQIRGTSRFVYIDQNSLKIDPLLIPVYSRPVKTIALSGSLVQDRRDDPAQTRSGFANTLDFGFAPQFSQTSTNYTRMVARNSSYHPINRETVFARSISFGYLHNLSDNPMPLPENFYSGGASTHRGFPDNQAGPRDLVTGFPVGGGAFLFMQHELRFPLIGDNLGAVLFHDMGNVYSSLDSLSFRFRQHNQQDFDYMVHAAGIGFRIKTPVGPMRLDLAFSPNTPRFVGFEGTREELYAGKGRYNVPQRVSRFQWHFSIGQTF
jgi:outer membrane protein assembly complex protein YaeT